jgi:DNA polymerase elongation subunit (family B)
MSEQLKVLVLDIETSPLLVYAWDLRDQNFSLANLAQDWFLMGFAAKWLGDPDSKVVYHDQRNAKQLYNDREILTPLWKLLDEADIVITQNGVNFDAPKINARFIMHGMTPPKPYRHLDTYQIAKRAARFTSNKLEYLTDKLCTKYKKLKHTKFPGLSLWINCIKGNPKAWDEMRRYNIHDVLSTEELYGKLRAWAPENAPDVFFGADPMRQCRVCGTPGRMTARGSRITKKSRFRRYQCQECGSWSSGARINKPRMAV